MKLGEKGEAIAAAFLRRQGYKVIKRNYKNAIGEIDIIAYDKGTLVFVEVKTRESITFGKPFESVTPYKKRKIANIAMMYLKGLIDIPPCRFDVVSISFNSGDPECELIRDAFEL